MPGSFARFFGSRDDVPAWASFFEPPAYRAFLGGVEAEMKRRRLEFSIADGVLRVSAGAAKPREYGLLNLAQLCNHTDRARWPEVIGRHFMTLFSAEDEAKAVEKLAADFEKVRAMIKVRLYPEDYAARLGLDHIVHRVPAAGLFAALVYDMPASIETVHPDHLKPWGRSVDELFRLGIDNVRAEGALQRQAMPLDRGASFDAFVGDTFFAASRALFLEELLGAPPKLGALVGVPHRHVVLVHRIEDSRVLLAINAMIPVCFGMYKEGPGSISPNLYWWRAGALTLLPSRVTAKSIEFAPPPVFVEEVLNTLAGGSPGAGEVPE